MPRSSPSKSGAIRISDSTLWPATISSTRAAPRIDIVLLLATPTASVSCALIVQPNSRASLSPAMLTLLPVSSSALSRCWRYSIQMQVLSGGHVQFPSGRLSRWRRLASFTQFPPSVDVFLVRQDERLGRCRVAPTFASTSAFPLHSCRVGTSLSRIS